jgi:hypothetical protein
MCVNTVALYFILRVPFHTGKPPRQVWSFQKDLTPADKAEAVFIEAGAVG